MEIEIRNLKKVFGTKTAVDIEKADIHDGEILGLVGNNERPRSSASFSTF